MLCQKPAKQQRSSEVSRLNVRHNRRGIMDEREDALRSCAYCHNEYKATSAVQRYCSKCIKFVKPLKSVWRLIHIRAGILPTYKEVVVSVDWENEEHAFIKWAMANGYEKGKFIDRIDPFGHYVPSNCRWITRSQNNWNRRVHTTDLRNGIRCCYKCKVWKAMDEFNVDKTRPLGKTYKCKQCNKGAHHV